MSQADWERLHDWLFRVFPTARAEEEYQRQVEHARRVGAQLPKGTPARAFLKGASPEAERLKALIEANPEMGSREFRRRFFPHYTEAQMSRLHDEIRVATDPVRERAESYVDAAIALCGGDVSAQMRENAIRKVEASTRKLVEATDG